MIKTRFQTMTEGGGAWKKRISQAKNVSAAWCHNCPHLGRNAAGCYGEPYCPLFPDWQDAAEFEARVAAKLANPRWAGCRHGDSCIEYGGDKEDIWLWGCEWCRLKHARIEVEEEMDADSK